MYLYGDKFLSEVKIHAWRLLSLYTNLSSGARQDDMNARRFAGTQRLKSFFFFFFLKMYVDPTLFFFPLCLIRGFIIVYIQRYNNTNQNYIITKASLLA